jgi:NAD(P)-dependent dehydrogenase (short-subunit alcohol dehydrogenase family)
MTADMKTEVAIVTGAGSGIGKATAVQLAAGGYHVVCADIDGEAAERSAREIGDGAATPCRADVSRDEDCRPIANLAAQKGSLRVLCNVAGICPPTTGITKVTEEMWDRVFAVNVKAIFLLSRACVPLLAAGPAGSVIVNVASVHAFAAQPESAPYAASKAAVVGLTRQMAVDLASYGIRVVAVAPGRVDTAMTQAVVAAAGTDVGSLGFTKDGKSIGWFADAPEIAEVVVWLASPGARFVNGATVVADGGLLAKMAD